MARWGGGQGQAELINKWINFEVTCEGHPNYSKTYFMNILRCFDDYQMWPQN